MGYELNLVSGGVVAIWPDLAKERSFPAALKASTGQVDLIRHHKLKSGRRKASLW